MGRDSKCTHSKYLQCLNVRCSYTKETINRDKIISLLPTRKDIGRFLHKATESEF